MDQIVCRHLQELLCNTFHSVDKITNRQLYPKTAQKAKQENQLMNNITMLQENMLKVRSVCISSVTGSMVVCFEACSRSMCDRSCSISSSLEVHTAKVPNYLTTFHQN